MNQIMQIQRCMINHHCKKHVLQAFTSSLLRFIHQSPLVLPKTDIQKSIKNQTQASITLANYIFTKLSPDSNVIFSPMSIQVILGLLAAGSKGQTLDQLLSFLKTKTIDDLNYVSSQLVSSIMTDGSKSGGPRLSLANGLWVEETAGCLKPSFKHVVDNVYKTVCKEVDFRNEHNKVTKEVNLWAEKQTNGLIKDILPPVVVDSSTVLILANAIYFKGVWNEKFDSLKTKNYDFHLLDGNKVQAPFMTSTKKQLVREYDGFKVLGIPYVNGKDKRRFTMYFFLPDEKDGLPSLIRKISSKSDFLESHIPGNEVPVGRFLIPKFKISFGFVASNMLKELGVSLLFGGEGLTEIMGRNLHVSSVIHKAFVEVNEEGTKAAAVTVAIVRTTSLRPELIEVDFVADHPFLFVIREDMSGAVLFMGQVIDPASIDD